ncbi:diacylglycerol kinase [Candidatus Oleimmundimicrobium sp.]|uniref:diacylglycerol kinase n=1 Tax=Candidatus Oleimmundimicrobium sp. TaxID=3060597 RepID=UPI0027171862|nr:diacylglycerol kinase [Candidatus Oleimmundimicrobium sp.]MDO8885843.1 diacylglycerol kinase [Candidatus Oleimmundimicrobium sp.]
MKDRSLIKSFNNAIEGIIYVLRTQQNIRIHFLAAIIVLMSSLVLGVSRIEFMLILFAISLVVSAELLNTAIEYSIDITITSFDPLAKIAKDVAAAAVLLASINALLVGYFVFFPLLSQITSSFFQKIKEAPIHLTITALLLVGILVIALKAWAGHRNFLEGGWPSGHSALAFSAAAAIAFIGNNIILTTLAFFMALIIAHSRIQSGVHSWPQVLVGSIFGFLVTTLLFQLFYF